MVQATKFLLRWLYLNNLIHEQSEIQSLPYIHPNWQQQENHQNGHNINQVHHEQQSYDSHDVQHQYDQQTRQLPQSHQIRSTSSSNSAHDSPHSRANEMEQNHITPQPRMPKTVDSEIEWKRKALHSIALYPPGSLRLLVLDSLRLEIVHELARELHNADKIVEKYSSLRKSNDHHLGAEHLGNDPDCEDYPNEADPYLDTDLQIIDDFQKATSIDLKGEIGGNPRRIDKDLDSTRDGESESDEDQTLLVISPPSESSHSFQSGSQRVQEPFDKCDEELPMKNLEPKVLAAVALQRETRDYLPQLVSAVLHSPAPLTQSTMFTPHLNPLATLRRLLMTRCVRDPNLGIELCWLLEAEVGRAWKSLFEHRQQTGRRLIIVLPADRAAAIQQIGSEKRAAFDLLQDVESATAYGIYGDENYEYDSSAGTQDPMEWHSQEDFCHEQEAVDTMGLYTTARLPASLSLQRCSHFGDTMHFIDLLTKISLDLRLCPGHQRNHYLAERLEELNRRLRRRMISKGNVSLDVEDNRGPHDWPTLGDISPDSMKYSIHFPLEPTATVWPGSQGDASASQTHSHSPLLELKTEHGVMRVLNIVSSKCRVLASRERCPYLVHCEVLETGLEGRDARLYASGSKEVGVTLQETLGVAHSQKFSADDHNRGFASYRIPSELSSFGTIDSMDGSAMDTGKEQSETSSKARLLPRGGGQEEGHDHSTFDEPGYVSSPYDLVREEQLQQLHEHFQANQQHPHYGPPPPPRMPLYPHENVPAFTRYSDLLDKVFGLPWAETCEQVRQLSPYGNVKGWRLASFILKAGEDIRREALVMQVISKMKTWFDSDIPMYNRPFLKPYTIMCVGGDAGLLECLRDAKSIDEVKKSTDGYTTLRDYFERAFGPPTPEPQIGPHANGISHQHAGRGHQHRGDISFEEAQDNFLRSLVGYSLVCYILQIKDRHNANILLDREGHIMHIDFGFVLGDTPKMGKVPLFSERAPFKLTAEFWEVIGGWNFNEGGLGVRFCKMFEEAFACASTHRDELVSLIEAAILNMTQDRHEARILANGVRNRLQMRGSRGSVQQKAFIMDLVNTALTSWGTSTYDWLQKSMNGYI